MGVRKSIIKISRRRRHGRNFISSSVGSKEEDSTLPDTVGLWHSDGMQMELVSCDFVSPRNNVPSDISSFFHDGYRKDELLWMPARMRPKEQTRGQNGLLV